MCVSDQILMTFAPCDLIPFVDNEGYPVLQQVTLGGCLKKKTPRHRSNGVVSPFRTRALYFHRCPSSVMFSGPHLPNQSALP